MPAFLRYLRVGPGRKTAKGNCAAIVIGHHLDVYFGPSVFRARRFGFGTIFWKLIVTFLVSASHLNGHPALQECTDMGGQPFKLGILFEEALSSSAMISLNGTFSSLSSVLAKHGCTGGVDLVMLTEAELHQDLAGLDMVFIDPGFVTNNIAGAMVRRADLHTALQSWEDLSHTTLTNGLSLCAVEGSFSSWLIQAREMLERGQRLEALFDVVWCDNQDQVLDRVYNGSCDVGAVGTPHLERVASQGSLPSSQTIPLSAWAVIGQASHADFPLLHSTRLYPEWALVRLGHAAPRLGDLVRSALLLLEADGNVAGFNFPADYREAATVEYHLDQFQDGRCFPGSERQLSGLGMCQLCRPGHFSETGIGRCLPCPIKTFTNETGSSACLSCGPGYSTYLKGSNFCEQFELAFEPIRQCETYPNNTLVIAKLHLVGELDMNQEWSPTFEHTINSFIKRFGCRTRLEVLDKEQLMERVMDESIHFAFVDAGFHNVLETQFGWVGMMSILRQHLGVITPYEGGVIFRKNASFQDVWSIKDLLGLKLRACAPDRDAFMGFIAQEFQFFLQGVDIFSAFADITFAFGQEETVGLVLDGACDIGMVKTHVLEEMELRGALSVSQFAIINNMREQAEAMLPNYPSQISTPLYHDWIFARAPDVAQAIWEQVQIPLMAIREDDDAAVIAGYSGFALVGDYQKEANVQYQLNLMDPATGVCAPGSVRDITRLLSPCVPCEAGTYNPNGLGRCVPCQAEYFSNQNGLTECSACPLGKIAHQVGSTECFDKKEVLVYSPIQACATYPNKTLTVGVLRTGDVATTRKLWAPTFEDALNDYFKRFDCYFQMHALSAEELEAAVQRRAVDFVFSYAGTYVNFKYDYGTEAIAEIVRYFESRSYSQMGGVIFRRNQCHQDVKQLADLQDLNLTACPVSEKSFASWIGPWYEFFSRGLDIFQVFSNITFTEDEHLTVDMVMKGDCDIGMVQTSLLEDLSNRGQLNLHDIFVINRTHYHDFPLLVSTLLYQEWPVQALPHVHPDIRRNAAIPLLAMREYDVASVLGKHAGFIIPKPYTLEEEIKFQLNLVHPEIDLCQKGSARDLAHPLKPCVKCPRGRYNNDGLATCRVCLPGFYNDEEGALSCKVCPAGKITYDSGQSECKPAEEVLTYKPIASCKSFKRNTLKIGVLQEGTKHETEQMWKPTFEGVMNEHFRRYQCFFEMVALDWQQIPHAVDKGEIDLLFADPGVYVHYRNSHGLKAVSSVVRILNHDVTPNLGGVIIRRTDNHPELHHLEDFHLLAQTNERLIACAVDLDCFSGWAAQWYEFFKRQIDINTVFREIIFSESNADTVEKVHKGECDIGMVRTSALERLVQQHLYQFEDFVIINANQQENGFVQVLSTELYPEWALGVLPHVPQEIADVVRIPLLAMRETQDAARAGYVAGFTTPYDYSNVSKVRYQLGLEPLKTCGPGAYRDQAAFLSPCFKCSAGYFNPDGMGECQACPLGTFASAPGASECLRCAFGYSTEGTGQAQCNPYQRHLTLSFGAQIAVWVLAAILFLLCAWIFVMVVIHRDTRLIKAASFHFSLLLILACGVVCASTVLFALEPAPNNWVCSLRWWVPCVFSSTVFGTLFSKTYRLYSIFRIYETKQKVPKSIRFKDTKVAALVACFVAVTAFVLAIFFGVDPPFYERRGEILEGQNFFTYADACRISQVFVPLIFALYTVLLTGQSYLAFKVRKLPTVFNESQLIAWLLYNTVFLGLVAIMVDYMLDWTQITVAMMVRSVALFLGSMTPVMVLYAPKLAEIFRDQENNTKYSTGDKTNSTGTGATHLEAQQNGKSQVLTSKVQGSVVASAQKSSKVPPAAHTSSGRSHKNARAVSVLSGVSDDGDEENGHSRFDVHFVPDSDVAGDEFFVADMSQQADLKQKFETRRSVLQLETVSVPQQATEDKQMQAESSESSRLQAKVAGETIKPHPRSSSSPKRPRGSFSPSREANSGEFVAKHPRGSFSPSREAAEQFKFGSKRSGSFSSNREPHSSPESQTRCNRKPQASLKSQTDGKAPGSFPISEHALSISSTQTTQDSASTAYPRATSEAAPSAANSNLVHWRRPSAPHSPYSADRKLGMAHTNGGSTPSSPLNRARKLSDSGALFTNLEEVQTPELKTTRRIVSRSPHLDSRMLGPLSIVPSSRAVSSESESSKRPLTPHSRESAGDLDEINQVVVV
eukprot:g2548.t1